MSPSAEPERPPLRSSLLLGTAAMTLVFAIAKVVAVSTSTDTHPLQMPWLVYLMAVLLAVLVGARIGRARDTDLIATAVRHFLVLLSGIALGVVVWVVLEEQVLRRLSGGTAPLYMEHAAPMEVGIILGASILPAVLGMGVGLLLGRFWRPA